MSHADQARVQHLLDLGRASEARDLARSLVANDPRDHAMFSMLADAEISTDGPETSLATIERALAIEPESSTYHAQRGHYLAQLGRHDESDDSFVQALTLNSMNSYALSAHVEAILRDPRTTRRRHKAARLALADSRAQALLHHYPNAAISHLMDSKVRLAHDDYVASDAAARRALAIEPNNPIGHQLVGFAAEARGDTRAAGDAFVNAQKADPTSSTGIEGLRRLGKGAAAPIGFGLFLAVRFGVKAGQRASGMLAVAFIVLVVAGTVAYLVWRSKESQREAEARLSSQARDVLEQDRKYS